MTTVIFSENYEKDNKYTIEVENVIWDFMRAGRKYFVKPEVHILRWKKGSLWISSFKVVVQARRIKLAIDLSNNRGLGVPGYWHLWCLDGRSGILFFATQSDDIKMLTK